MAPVVVFAYNRSDLLRSLLSCLRSEAVPLLYVFSDGPRGAADEAAVAAVRREVERIDWCPKRVVLRGHNLGLGRSIREGVTDVLREHESVVVFEDDLVCAPGTYRYLVSALDRYRSDTRVMSATGWTHPRLVPRGVRDRPYFDGKGESWSWATWARAWEGMDAPAAELLGRCRREGLDVERYGTDMPKMAAEAERRNLWAVGWWYLHLLRGGLCLRPPWSLVEHLGWDGRATTTVPVMEVWKNPPLRPAPVPGDWPEPVEHPDCPRLWREAIDAPPGPT